MPTDPDQASRKPPAEPPAKERPVLEALLEMGEVVADAAIPSVLSDLPVIGTAWKLLRAKDSVANRMLLAKMQRFIEPALRVSAAERAAWGLKLRSRPDEFQQVGSMLTLLLDRVTDIEKPYILGCLFVACLEDRLAPVDLRRLAHAVDLAFIGDLEQLLTGSDPPAMPASFDVESLAAAGLALPMGGTTWGAVSRVAHSISPLGIQLRDAFRSVDARPGRGSVI